jgi:NAD(P)-dependent dehydrogenase (short-subunit alcohol dehydrogenase family)
MAAAVKNKFDGKVAIITGASSGFGANTARHLSKEGALLSLTDREAPSLEVVAQECRELGAKVVLTVGDITSEETRVMIVENTVKSFGRVDVLLNSAGVYKDTCITQPSDTNFDSVMDINVRSLYRMSALCVPHLIKTRGNIVNISSVAAKYPVLPTGLAYHVSKAAVDMLTKSTALELAPFNVRVNSVNPGFCHTGILRHLNVEKNELEKMWQDVGQDHALGRTGEVQEVTNVIAFLASDEASFMTGSNVVVDGGYLIHKHTVSN